jgi:hypothetical protein
MGGGKGGSEPQTIQPVQTITDFESKLEGPGATLTDKETSDREEAVATKRKGVRGLRIPLNSSKSTTTPSPGSTGVNP